MKAIYASVGLEYRLAVILNLFLKQSRYETQTNIVVQDHITVEYNFLYTLLG